MHFPFRRSPAGAWAIRLPQLERSGASPPRSDAPLPQLEAGGRSVRLTSSVLPRVTARDVAGDPAAAETLPATLLVGTILECDAENRSLSLRLEAREQELQDLRQGLTDHLVEDAEIRGRLLTLEDVIAALHANLEDLRLQRDQLLADSRS